MTCRRALLVPAVLSLVLGVTGCGTSDELTSDALRPDSAAGTGAVSSACPVAPGADLPPSCSPYDGEAAMALNEAYRERSAAGPAGAAELESHAARIAGVLEALLKQTPHPSERHVVDQLVAAGYDPSTVQAYASLDPPGVIRVAVDWRGTCLVGEVGGGRASVAPAGGYIADGGCLTAPGH